MTGSQPNTSNCPQKPEQEQQAAPSGDNENGSPKALSKNAAKNEAKKKAKMEKFLAKQAAMVTIPSNREISSGLIFRDLANLLLRFNLMYRPTKNPLRLLQVHRPQHHQKKRNQSQRPILHQNQNNKYLLCRQVKKRT